MQAEQVIVAFVKILLIAYSQTIIFMLPRCYNLRTFSHASSSQNYVLNNNLFKTTRLTLKQNYSD